MSTASDIRMYVEHLFEGRTLTAETIELKEEIFGNLMARYEDYLAQGMSADEAYRRTCEAVTSVDDVMGERDARAGDEGGRAAGAPPEPTRVMPRAEAPSADDGAPAPPAPSGAAHGPRSWGPGRIAAVVAGVVVVGAIVIAALNPAPAERAGDAPQGQASQTAQQTDGSAATAGTGDEAGGATSQTTDPSGGATGGGSSAQPGGGSTGASASGLDAEVYAHQVSELSARSGAHVGDAAVDELVRELPLGGYVTEVNQAAGSGTVTVTYTYQDRDRVAYDDDVVDQALVYDAVALLATVSDLNSVEVIEVEDDGRDYDRDRHVFDRSAVEGALGTSLGASMLSDDAWGTLRDRIMTTRDWDRVWETADRD